MPSRRKKDPQRNVEWNFVSFEAAFAFSIGAFLAVLLAPLAYGIVFIISLFGVSFGIAHIVSHFARRKMLDRRLQRAEEDERERRAVASRNLAAKRGEEGSARRRRRRKA
jgi:hypothetical protein